MSSKLYEKQNIEGDFSVLNNVPILMGHGSSQFWRGK